MIRFPWRFLMTALAAAWAVDFLFWKKPIGISFLIWVILLVLGGFLLAFSEGIRFSKKNIVLLAGILSMAILVFFREEPFTQAFSFLFAIFLIGLLVATYRSGFWLHFRLVDHIISGFHTFLAAFARPFDLSAKEQAEEAKGISWKAVPRKALPILRGLILALPIVIVLGVLLASADPIFSNWMQDWLKIFDLERIAEYIFRFFYILVMAYLFTGLYLHAIHPRREMQQPDSGQPWMKGFLGSPETIVVLVSVNLLFAVFLFVQFRYFFGGSANISETGYTYSEYARRGFGELVAVAVLSLLLYLGLGTIARQQTKIVKRSFTVLSVLLLFQVMVMLVSAFQRLLLYENAYGFTRLRTYSHVFMVWLGTLLVATVVMELARRRGRFALALLGAAFGFGLTLGILNVDGVVVRQNVLRAQDNAELDADYLKTLTSDAVPVMLETFLEQTENELIYNTLGAELACRAVLLEEETNRPWQGFSWSRARATHLLKQYQQELKAYPVSKQEGEWVVTLAGKVTTCQYFAD